MKNKGLNRMVELRKECSMSQQALADLLFTSQQSVDSYEKGRYQPDIEMLKSIATIFNVSVDYLIEFVDIRTPISKISTYELTEVESSIITSLRKLPPEKQQYLALFLNDHDKE